jgi:membrane protease YdiL (CAAX protease family)
MHAIFSLATITLCFLIFHFTINSSHLKNKFQERWGEKGIAVYFIYFQRMLGFLLYGIVPACIIAFSELSFLKVGVVGTLGTEVMFWSLGLSVVVIIMNFFAAKSSDNLVAYPQIRSKVWTPMLTFKSALTWSLYLVAYEFFFRGYLLFSWNEEAGKLPAITVNVAVYALVHVPKGVKEAIGAIPLGIVLCLLTLKTGVIWIPIFVHIAMALSNEWFSIYYQKRTI